MRDTSPDAYEKLVDRLLASPRYGERWARHWLDVVHYGESHGYDKDKPRRNAWPYRDYVIRSLNEDKPWDRFVREQIAGDVSVSRRSAGLCRDRLPRSRSVGLRRVIRNCAKERLTRTTPGCSTAMTLSRRSVSTFSSMTAHCARCHDHKFDPIPQQDYYNLQSVFAGIDRADRPGMTTRLCINRRQQLLREKQDVQRRLQPLLDKVEFATSPEIVDARQLDSGRQSADHAYGRAEDDGRCRDEEATRSAPNGRPQAQAEAC